MKLSLTNCRILLILGFGLLVSTFVSGQNKVPRFEQFPAGKIFTGRNAKPVIKGETRQFRTRVRNGANAKRNFAAEYVITLWGCGTTCLGGAVINVRTGSSALLPSTVCCWAMDDDIDPIEYRLNSRLIIFTGLRNESEDDSANDRHYYEFRNGRFIFLKTIKRRASDEISQSKTVSRY